MDTKCSTRARHAIGGWRESLFATARVNRLNEESYRRDQIAESNPFSRRRLRKNEPTLNAAVTPRSDCLQYQFGALRGRKWKGMPMKTVKSVLFALGAAGLSAAMTLPASAQQFKGRGCDNVSTSRDKTPKPDSRCMLTADERYLQEQNRLFAFIHANPPTKTTKAPNGMVIYEGRDRNGDDYRIASGAGTAVGTGSAAKVNGGGGRGGTKPR